MLRKKTKKKELLAKVAAVYVSFDFCFCRMGELLDK
jgi:hypothetical protein